MNLQEMTLMRDEELVMLAHEGNPEAVDFLMEKYKPLVRKKARALFLIGGENDDLIQEGMIALFKALREYDPSKESSFGGFASVCVGRHLCNVIKCANRLKNVPLNSYVSIYAPAGSSHESSRETVGDTLQPQEGGRASRRLFLCCIGSFAERIKQLYLSVLPIWYNMCLGCWCQDAPLHTIIFQAYRLYV